MELNDLDSTSVKIVLIKFPENGYWDEENEPSVMLRDVAAYSSQLEPAGLFLLLGADDPVKVRLLIAPRDGRTAVIKTLTLSFAEATARLEKEWQRLHAKSPGLDMGETVSGQRPRMH